MGPKSGSFILQLLQICNAAADVIVYGLMAYPPAKEAK